MMRKIEFLDYIIATVSEFLAGICWKLYLFFMRLNEDLYRFMMIYDIALSDDENEIKLLKKLMKDK